MSEFEKNDAANETDKSEFTQIPGGNAEIPVNMPHVAEKPKKAPLISIVKRDALPVWQQILIRAGALLAALAVCSIIILIFTKSNPFSVYATMFTGAFFNNQYWPTLHGVAILLCIALAITPAFKMKFWNVGAEGQVLVGALMTAVMMYLMSDSVKSGQMPEWVLIVISVVCAVTAGAIWGVLPAFFKAYWKTNETLFTLMMNYVAIQLVNFFLGIAGGASNTVGPRLLSKGWLPAIGGQQYLFNIIIVALLTVLMFVYLKFSKHGYEISVVGESENTAKYVGINVKKVIIRTMILSGAICGLAGFMLVSGADHSITANTVKGRGFTAIMVSWLAKFNPFMMILTALLLVFFEKGSRAIASKFPVINLSFADILSGIILFFIIGCEFFVNYRMTVRKSGKVGGEA